MAGEGGRFKCSQQIQTSSWKINTRDVKYNMIDIINTATQTHAHVYIKVVKRMNPGSSHHKEKNVFCFFFLDYGCSLNLFGHHLVVYVTNNDTVFFKLIQCCVNYVAIKLKGNNEIRCFF